MAKGRSGKRKSTSGKRGKRKGGSGSNLVKTVLGLILLSGVVLAGVGLVRFFIPEPVQEKKPLHQTSAKPVPPFEVFPEAKIPLHAPAIPPAPPAPVPGPPPSGGLPKVAIIIDDLGYDLDLARAFMNLDAPLTLAFLPQGPESRILALEAKQKGFETLLHQPMEPREYPKVQPGPGALLTDMSPDELISQLENNLGLLPDIKGVNNHMGSKMTEDPARMNQVFSVLKRKGFFFVDSVTTPESRGESSARLFKIPFGKRDVFIDHIEDRRFIKSQLEELVRTAKARGFSVGIAHPREITYQVLGDMLPELRKHVDIVPVSELVQPPD